MNMDSSIGALNGIGPKTEQIIQKLGVYTIGDMLLAFPRDYKKIPPVSNLADIEEGKEYAVHVRLMKEPVTKNARNLQVTLATVADRTASIQAVWFRMPYIKNQLKELGDFILLGRVSKKNHVLEMEHPLILKQQDYTAMLKTLQPVYSLPKGISSKQYGKFVRSALEQMPQDIEFMPEEIRTRIGLMDYAAALKQIHFPDTMELLAEARRRLVFDEFFLFILRMQRFKEHAEDIPNAFPVTEDGFIEQLLDKLPFALTQAQQRVLGEMKRDIKSAKTMQRLLQGDVGSGKTILAYLMMVQMAHMGYQSAIMAPTEVLARQHYETFSGWMTDFGLSYPVILLTGSLTPKQKREAYAQILEYPDALIIGTHALIQEKAEYQNLALVVTDEQHRFGVRQRETFAQKGESQPHVLVMSATPIPRTLAIILYGDLDISVVDELPANRLPIKNCVVKENMREKSWHFIKDEINKGHQAYVICPLVEENEELELEDVISYTQKLKKFDASIEVAFLYGKMKAEQKNQIMEDYLAGKIQVLVSTTVIEVGVNVPNATVMMIENAQRFGLAQLHQLRGRVGRGNAQSYCIMMNTTNGKEAQERLEILNHSNDGFYIAGKDLKMRGPGDFFGIRQSGLMEFKIADIFQDANVLSIASKEAKNYIEKCNLNDCEKGKKLERVLTNVYTNRENGVNI